MTFKADLHCHSICSDGTLSGKELIDLAVKSGLSALSITDHDSIKVYTEELFNYAKQKKLLLLTGAEFSSVHRGSTYHLLGYGMDVFSTKLIDFCGSHVERRKKRNKGILKKLSEIRMPITEEELAQYAPVVVGRPHIAMAMVEKGYVVDIQEAFKTFIGDGGSCFVQGEYFTVDETIDLIHEVGGQVVVAHPMLIKSMRNLREIIKKGVDGLECYYSTGKESDTKKMLRLAEEYNLFATGGSDYHGTSKPWVDLGASYTNEHVFYQLYKQG